MASWYAPKETTLRSAGIMIAYLHGRPRDRGIRYKIPRGGIPGEGIPDGAVLAARAPTHGTRDAGRGFRLELKSTVQAQRLSLDFVLRALFALRSSGGLYLAMRATSVVDLLYGPLPGGGAAAQCLMDRSQVGKVESHNCWFCGKEYVQGDEHNVSDMARDNTERIGSVTHNSAKKLDPPAAKQR